MRIGPRQWIGKNEEMERDFYGEAFAGSFAGGGAGEVERPARTVPADAQHLSFGGGADLADVCLCRFAGGLFPGPLLFESYADRRYAAGRACDDIYARDAVGTPPAG